MNEESLRVLGIDPGLQRTGYACVEVKPGSLDTRLVEAGLVRLKASAPISERLRQLEADLEEILAELKPHAVVVESVFSHGSHVRTAIVMAHARGVVLLCAARRGARLVELAPKSVKKAFTGSGSASKRQMQVAAMTQFGLAAPPEPADVADAMAIAACGARRLG